MIDFQSVNGWYKNSFGEDSFGGFSRGILSGIIAPRPAGPYPDISLAGKNPMSVALTERHHESQDNYLLGKKAKISRVWPPPTLKIGGSEFSDVVLQMHTKKRADLSMVFNRTRIGWRKKASGNQVVICAHSARKRFENICFVTAKSARIVDKYLFWKKTSFFSGRLLGSDSAWFDREPRNRNMVLKIIIKTFQRTILVFSR